MISKPSILGETTVHDSAAAAPVPAADGVSAGANQRDQAGPKRRTTASLRQTEAINADASNKAPWLMRTLGL
jgi:hypothetical protein